MSSLIPMVFACGWASGVNAYLVVLVLGLADRLGTFAQIPDSLGNTWVLASAAVLYAVEFVTDKIPYVDSTWDSISTLIRPTIAAALAAVIAGDVPTPEQLGYIVLGGGTALASHSVKAGARLAINSSPEPLTNAGASFGEDVTVLGVVALAIGHPWLALGLSAVLLVCGLTLVFFLLRFVRRGWRRWKGVQDPGRQTGGPRPAHDRPTTG